MLVTLKHILQIAEAKQFAVGSFNTTGLECIEAVLGAAEELNVPVVLMHAQIHEEMGLCKLDTIGRVMRLMAERALVPVAVHLDHGTDLAYIHRALDLGFTSVMYDGSNLPYEENLANTCVAVELAARTGASVEAEIGSMGVRDCAPDDPANLYTDPAAAQRFTAASGIDALACAFGTVHGIYLKQPKLDLARLAEIDRLVDRPLVMHGGSGISDDDYRAVLARGVRKINYYTYMAKAGGAAAAACADPTYFHDIARTATAAMQANVRHAMAVFSGKE